MVEVVEFESLAMELLGFDSLVAEIESLVEGWQELGSLASLEEHWW